jgi:hypothetical protein
MLVTLGVEDSEYLGAVASSESTVPTPGCQMCVWNIDGMIIGRGKQRCLEKNLH